MVCCKVVISYSSIPMNYCTVCRQNTKIETLRTTVVCLYFKLKCQIYTDMSETEMSMYCWQKLLFLEISVSKFEHRIRS